MKLALLFYVVGALFFFFHLFSFLVAFFLLDGLVLVFYFKGLDLGFMFYEFIIYLDLVSVVFFRVVMLISFVVFFYVRFYMGDIVFVSRFYWLVFLFVVSIVLLVFSPRLFSVVLGWDGLGMTSFLLVCFYDDIISLFSRMVVFLANRFGDAILLLSFYWFISLGDLVYFYLDFGFSFGLSFLYFLVFFTKRAQFPFMVWLPLAMAAPTPVSSLVHSSTLVAAGVYLVVRYYFFVSFLMVGDFVRLVSLLTFLLSGIMGLVEIDVKKVIAFSTLSQLSIMIYIIRSGFWVYGYLLLIFHALYKSLLFLVFGFSIRVSRGLQDGRFMSIAYFDFPLIMVLFLLSCFSLFGIPFFSGFFVKDLFFSFMVFFDYLFLEFLLFFGGCVFTFLYRLKILRFLYFSWFKGVHYVDLRIDYLVFLSLMYLSFFRIFFGGFFVDLVLVDLFVVVYFLEKLIPLIVIFFGGFLYYVFFFYLGESFVFWRSFFYLYYFSYDFWYALLGRLYHFFWSDRMWLELLVYKGFVGLLNDLSFVFWNFIYLYLGVTLLFFFVFFSFSVFF